MKSAVGYEFRGQIVSDYVGEALDRYAQYGTMPGGFLSAVISNNLHESFRRADETNTQNMAAIVAWLHNEPPAACWGSQDQMDRWISVGGKEGADKASWDILEKEAIEVLGKEEESA